MHPYKIQHLDLVGEGAEDDVGDQRGIGDLMRCDALARDRV